MGLIELCLLSLVSPQEPEPVPVPTPPAAESSPGEVAPAASEQDPQPEQEPVEPREQLRAAEQQGAHADPAELAMLACQEDADIAARAAWLLTRGETSAHRAALADVLRRSEHPEARALAMQNLLDGNHSDSAKAARHGLRDGDRRVRTMAAQLLGRLRDNGSVESLVAMIDEASNTEDDTGSGRATDVQAAVLALTDLGAKQHLLRMATSIHDGQIDGVGSSLAYSFQTLSPQLEAAAETTLLVAVLAHRETVLRRYAITRLAELDSTTAIHALEGRLAVEGDELRPLVENALAQLRHDTGTQPTDEVERAKANAKILWDKTTTWWSGLEPLHQGVVAGGPILFLLLIIVVRRLGRRRADQDAALAAAELVQPSDDYYDDQDEDYYEDDQYDESEEGADDDQDFDPQASAEGEEVYDDDEDGAQYDTSGWEEDGEDETLLAEGGLDDERFR